MVINSLIVVFLQLFTNFVYNNFCGSNLSKYLIANSKKDEKIAVFLKVCDSYSFNQLLKENRIIKEKNVLMIY